jgi:uncharacterized glyoxalase superfamily protein PhnB
MISNRTMPASMVIPELVYDDVGKAVEWLCRVFGFTVRWQLENHRAQLAVGNGCVVVRETPLRAEGDPPAPEQLRAMRESGRVHSVLVRVEDVDAHHERARQAGAEIVEAPRSHPYGERQYLARDLAGHRWSFSQSIADLAPEDWGGVSGPAAG